MSADKVEGAMTNVWVRRHLWLMRNLTVRHREVHLKAPQLQSLI